MCLKYQIFFHKNESDVIIIFQLILGESEDSSLRICGSTRQEDVQRLSYLSYGSRLTVTLHTGSQPSGSGFRARFYFGIYLYCII